MDVGLLTKGDSLTGKFFGKDNNEEGFYYRVTSALLNKEPIDEECKWCEHCNDELPINHTCIP